MNEAPTILLTIPAGHNAANLLRGEFLATLLGATPRRRVVVVSPLIGDPRFLAEFAQPGVVFEPLHAYEPPPIEAIISRIVSEQFLVSSGLTAVRLQRDRADLTRAGGRRRLLPLAMAGLSRLPVGRRAWLAAARRLSRARPYRTLFETYHPALVVTATAGFLRAEIPLIHEAKRQGVPLIAVDLGWDNISSKYHVIQPVDTLVVWNDLMREWAIRHHGYAPGQVSVAGVAHFDGYFRREGIPARADFFKTIGADESRRLVTLATAPPEVYDGVPRIAAELARAIVDSRLADAAQLLVRVHPRDNLERYRPLIGAPHVVVEKPFTTLRVSAGFSPYDGVFPTAADRVHLAATLRHSDVMVNFASTLTVEACVFDLPVISIGFDDVDGLPLPLSIRRYYAFEHYRPILDARAVTVAASADDLVRAVGRSLAHREDGHEGREVVARTVCGRTDGRSAERLGKATLRALDAATRCMEPAR